MQTVTEQPSDKSKIDENDSPASELIKRYQVRVNDLDFGMFIAELDRPWLDTPFLLQGFPLEAQLELDTIRKYCEYVFVDFELSAPHVSEAILLADMTRSTDVESIVIESHPRAFAVESDEDEPQAKKELPFKRQRELKARSDLKVSTAAREKLKQSIRGQSFGNTSAQVKQSFLAKVMSWLGGRKVEGPAVSLSELRRRALEGMIDPSLKLRNYRTKIGIAEELPRARQTFARSEAVLNNFATDIRNGKPAQIREVQGVVIDMVDSMIENPDALIWIARLRDEDVRTYNHGVKVALYLVAFGRYLGFPKEDLAHLGMIGMLADIGKTKLPRNLIDKPGMLSPSEFALIKEHVSIGLRALKKTMTLPISVEQGIVQHHERLDGSGYPLGLKGDQISIYGRMTAIADCFAALITPRAYANPSAPQDALMNLFQWAGTAFHEPLIEQFVQAVGVFPIGSLVELSTGEVAVVLAHNRTKRLEPKVLVLTGTDKNPKAKPVELDLHRSSRKENEKPTRIVRGLPAGAYGLKLKDYYMADVSKANGLA